MNKIKQNNNHSIKFVEQALLAGILIDLSGKNIQDADTLTPADFYDSRNREIFANIKELHAAGKVIDLTSFADTEHEDYILELMGLPDGLLNIEKYIEEIKEESIKRQRLSLIDDFKENKINYDELINLLQKLYVGKKEPICSSHLIEHIKPIQEKNIFGIKIQYGAVFTIAGATSAGKTEFSLEIADIHAKQDCVSIYCVFEGGINEFAIRLKKKNINNENLFMLHNPDINDIRAAIDRFKDKKVLVIIDYLQMFARRLQANDDKPSDFLRKYTSYIYAKLDEIRAKYNVCFCLLSALNNQGIGELRLLQNFDDTIFLKSIKEDGNVQYDNDYLYAILFADDAEKKENKWSLGRKKIDRMRKYTLLHPAKPSRIGEEAADNLYIYDVESGRYQRVDKAAQNFQDNNKEQNNETQKNDYYAQYGI
ncbi:MAG: DnaB-like helicase N-terminal domain-containing protein [bacterium]